MSRTRSIMEGFEKCPLCGKYYDEKLGCECWTGENAEYDECVKCDWCGEYFQNCICNDEEVCCEHYPDCDCYAFEFLEKEWDSLADDDYD